jgi:hypothetical protein
LTIQDFTDTTQFPQFHRVSEELVVSVLRVAKEGGTMLLTRLFHSRYAFLHPHNLSMNLFFDFRIYILSSLGIIIISGFSPISYWLSFPSSFTRFYYFHLFSSSLYSFYFVLFIYFFMLFSFNSSIPSSVHCPRAACVGAPYGCACTYGYYKIKNLSILDGGWNLNPIITEGSNTLHVLCQSAASVAGNV